MAYRALSHRRPTPRLLNSLVYGALATLLATLLTTLASCSIWPGDTSTAQKPTPTPTPKPLVANLIPTTNPFSDLNELIAVAPVSATDAWVVGFGKGQVGKSLGGALIYHWDGTNLKAVPTGLPSAFIDSRLLGVAAVSANDVWAVGESLQETAAAFGGNKGLIEHWNGAAWQVIPSPGQGGERLHAVAAVSASDVWAVGRVAQQNPTRNRTLVLHWNGSAWQNIPSPNVGDLSELLAVSAVAPNDVWAVGKSSQTDGAPSQRLVMHWDGTAWTVVSDPLMTGNGVLQGVKALSSKDVWVVGVNNDAPLVAHWDGAAWTEVRGLGPDNVPWAVTAAPDGAVALVGESASPSIPLTRWDGTRLQVTTAQSPDLSPGTIVMQGIAALSATEIWAVGFYTPQGGKEQTIAMRLTS